MALSYTSSGEYEVTRYPYRGWDDEIWDRAAEALYLWRWPKASWFVDLAEQSERAIEYFYEWAEQILDAGLPEGVDSGEWDEEEAGRVYYCMSHEGCMYEDAIDYRWPQVGWWYEKVASSVLEYAVNEVPVDNTDVLPIAFRFITRRFN